MAATGGIHSYAPNLDYHFTLPLSDPSKLPYKRRILDRWTNRIKASGLPGNDLVSDYLHEKYVKNLSHHTINHAGRTILAFMHFLKKGNSSLLALTRRDISAFVEYEQDRGLKVVSIISQLRGIYAFVSYLVRKEVISPEIMNPKVRMQEPDTLPKAIPYEDIESIFKAVTSVRDRALLMLLYRTGMRIGELLEVRVDDIVLNDQKILLYIGAKKL